MKMEENKKRCNFLLSERAKHRLNQISNNSIKYIGRNASMSQIIEILIDRAFMDREQYLKMQEESLKSQLEPIQAELNAYKLRRKNQEAIQWNN